LLETPSPGSRHVASHKALAILALALSGFAGPIHAQTQLHVYGPGGPAPAMQEAAKAFGAAH
jgi:accessory colonization factor AcfC